MPRCAKLAKLLAGLSCLLGPAWTGTAAAHGFGQRYDLPIPLSFYIWSAGATVALSFVGFALFLRREHGQLGPAVEWRPKQRLVGAIVLSARALTVGTLMLIVVAGFFGNQDPIRNIAPVMIWISDINRNVTFFNRVWLEFRGRSMDQEIGEGWTEGVHPDDQQSCRQAYDQALEARRGFDLEFRLRRADGEYRWVLERTAPRHAPDGSFAGFIGSCLDVTERKQAEEVLRASEKRFRELLESLPVAVRIVQRDTVVFANAADARLHGFESPREEFAVDASTQISPQDLPRVIEYARRRIAGEPAPRCYEVRRRRRDGTEFQAELDAETIVFDGAPAVLVAVRDLTDRKRIEMYEKLLPVCCVCGKIRDDADTEHGAGHWGRFEEYLAAHSDAKFSHTFCPECFEDYRKKNLMR